MLALIHQGWQVWLHLRTQNQWVFHVIPPGGSEFISPQKVYNSIEDATQGAKTFIGKIIQKDRIINHLDDMLESRRITLGEYDRWFDRLMAL